MPETSLSTASAAAPPKTRETIQRGSVSAPPAPYVYSLMPRPLSAVFDEAFDLYRQRFFLLALIVAVIYVPTQIAMHLLETQWLRPLSLTMEGGDEASAISAGFQLALGYLLVGAPQVGIPGVLSLMSLFIASGPVTVAVADIARNQPVSVFSAYRKALPHALRLITGWFGAAAGFLAIASVAFFVYLIGFALIVASVAGNLPDGAAIAIVLLWFLIPYVLGCSYIAFGFLFASPLLVLENEPLFTLGARNSALIGRKRFLRTWLATIYLPLVLFGLQFLILLSVLSVVETFHWAALLEFAAQVTSASLLSFFFQPYWMVFLTLLYYDYRTRREGIDLRQMASALELPEPRIPQYAFAPPPNLPPPPPMPPQPGRTP